MQLIVSRNCESALQTQIFDQIRGMILDGRLRPGAPLPSTRVLSRELGVSRNTVMLAYDKLSTEGYVRTRTASHTYINNVVPESALFTSGVTSKLRRSAQISEKRAPVLFSGHAPRLSSIRPNRPPIDFWVGCPHARAFPRRLWQRLLLRNLQTAGTNLTEYGDPAGYWRLREAISEHLGSARGINADPGQIIIVHGIQEALNIVARLFVERGSMVAVEDPCYQGAAYLFQSCGAKLIPVRVDSDGLDVDRLPRAGVRIVYVTPSHQFPTGRTLPQERRRELLRWAERTGAYIIEDDYDSDFRYDGPPLKALYGLDEADSVIYLGTFSKSLGAGLRTGYMVVPKPLQATAAKVKTLTTNGQSWLEQATLADLIRTGAFARHLRLIRQRYLEARDALIDGLRESFGDVELSGQEGGMHLLWHLSPELPSVDALQALARSCGVGIYNVQDAGACVWHAKSIRDRTLAIGYARLTPDLIREGVLRIARTLPDRNQRLVPDD